MLRGGLLKMNEEIEKLDKDYMAACRDYLDAEDTFDDARTARNAASKVMLIASKALDSAIHYDKSIKDD